MNQESGAKAAPDIAGAESGRVPSSQASPLNSQPPAIPDHELIRCIGHGSYGEVWLARSKLATLRAVKIVYRQRFEDSRPFEREFKGIQKFEPISRSHDGVVDILQVGGGEDYFYYVMELADGAEEMKREEGRMKKPDGSQSTASNSSFSILHSSLEHYTPRTLRSEVRRLGRLPLSRCLDIGQSLAGALAHLHAQGLVHRDIKPSNIIFVQGAPKLADIGLVADASEARSFVGTEGFIPPEGPGAAQADLYSLGKVLYEISTGRDRRDFPALPDDLAEDEAMLELNAVILKTCKNDLRERYQSAAEIQVDLALLQSGRSVKRKRVMDWRLVVIRRISVVGMLLTLFVAGLYTRVSTMSRRIHGVQQLTSSELATMEGTKNVEAYIKYVQGRTAMRQRNREGLREGLKLMNEAVELDPTFLKAWGELFINYVHGRWENADALTQMRLIAQKLEELNANSAEAHFAKAWLAHLDPKSTEAEKEFLRAIQLDPSRPYAHSLFAAYLISCRRLSQARQHLDECMRLDPGFWLVPDLSGDCFFMERNYPAAIAQYKKALSFAHQNIGAYERLGRLYEATHQIMDAIDAFQKARTYGGEEAEKVAQRYNELRQAFQGGGEQGYWLKRLEQAEAEQNPEKQPYAFAVIQARLGHTDEALALLEKAWEVKDFGLGVLFKDQCWDELRGNERFKELLKKLGYRTDWPIK